mgnify:FL=1
MKHAVRRMMVILAACGVLAGGFLACQNDVESPAAYYTVSFNSDGGSFVAAQSVQSGKTAVEPKSPTKEAYTFDGWHKDGEAFDFATPITADTTLIAAWQAVKTQTPEDTTPSDESKSDDNGNPAGNGDTTGSGDNTDSGNTAGTGDNGNGDTPGSGDSTDTGDNSDNNGNDDTGTDDNSGSGSSGTDTGNNDGGSDTDTPAGTETMHTVSYSVGTGTLVGVSASATYHVGETVTLGAAEREKYLFMGWKDADGTIYESGSTITMGDADITLTAQWTAGVLITESDTTETIGQKIQGMTTSGMVKVTGAITQDRLKVIDAAVKSNHNNDEVYIDLDIGDTTGLTSLTGTYAKAASFFSCDKYTSIVLPKQDFTEIKDYAFSGLKKLQSVTIPDSLTSIGIAVFYLCSKLTDITIPDSVTSIATSAFNSCSELPSITIPDSVTSIGHHAFHGCSKLTSITIPDSVESMGTYLFCSCESLKTVKLSENLKGLYGCAFSGCKLLESVVIPDSVERIRGEAFKNCMSLKSVSLGAGVTYIDANAFFMDAADSLQKVCFDETKTKGWYVYPKNFPLDGSIPDDAIGIDSNTVADSEAVVSLLCTRYLMYCWKRFDD